MPWCPTCKNEYREGMDVCADCGSELDATLEKTAEPELLFVAENYHIAKKFSESLEYADINEYEIRENEFGEAEIYLMPHKITDARKLLLGFQLAMQNEEFDDIPDNLEIPTDEEERMIKKELEKQQLKEWRDGKSSVYVKAADKYIDLKFSAISFILFAAIGFALIALNLVGIMSFLSSFSTVIMGVIFIVFLVIGIVTLSKASSIKAKIGEEESKTEEVTVWMKDRFTNSYYDSFKDDSVPAEKHYFLVIDQLMDEITEAFPNMERNYLEQLVDENYNTYLEHYGNK